MAAGLLLRPHSCRRGTPLATHRVGAGRRESDVRQCGEGPRPVAKLAMRVGVADDAVVRARATLRSAHGGGRRTGGPALGSAPTSRWSICCTWRPASTAKAASPIRSWWPPRLPDRRSISNGSFDRGTAAALVNGPEDSSCPHGSVQAVERAATHRLMLLSVGSEESEPPSEASRSTPPSTIEPVASP
jgi:hypothetical protein